MWKGCFIACWFSQVSLAAERGREQEREEGRGRKRGRGRINYWRLSCKLEMTLWSSWQTSISENYCKNMSSFGETGGGPGIRAKKRCP